MTSREALAEMEAQQTMLTFAYSAELLRAPEPASVCSADLFDAALGHDLLELLAVIQGQLRDEIQRARATLGLERGYEGGTSPRQRWDV